MHQEEKLLLQDLKVAKRVMVYTHSLPLLLIGKAKKLCFYKNIIWFSVTYKQLSEKKDELKVLLLNDIQMISFYLLKKIIKGNNKNRKLLLLYNAPLHPSKKYWIMMIKSIMISKLHFWQQILQESCNWWTRKTQETFQDCSVEQWTQKHWY